MIPVSMSRKTASFGQLIDYMQDDEKSQRAYDLHHHCMARGRSNIAEEFLANSRHLPKHKSRNMLYHEIISISLEEGVEMQYAKDALREIAQKWIDARCPNNMAYGCLHEDHANHLHYHLLISANELGQASRLRLSKSEFESVKQNLEAHVLENYPKLKQKAINTRPKKERSESRKATAQKRRTGKLETREAVRATVTEAMLHTSSLEEFETKLMAQNFKFYTRGKNFGVEDLSAEKPRNKFRFSTLGIHETYEEFASLMQSLSSAQNEPQEDKAAESDTQEPKREESSQGREKPAEPQEASHGAHEDPQGPFEEPLESDVVQNKQDLRSFKTTAQENQNPNHGREEFLRELEERAARRNERKREKALKQHQRRGKPKGRSR